MVVAEHGNIVQQKDGSQVVTLDKGTRFEGTALLRDFRITDFTDYKAVIGPHRGGGQHRIRTDVDADAVGIRRSGRTRRVPLAPDAGGIGGADGAAGGAAQRGEPAPGPRAEHAAGHPAVSDLLPVQTSLRSNAGKGKLDPMLWLWLVNGVYFAIALALNLWDTVPMRKLRARLRGAA